jgi:hypothetical protein
MVEWNHPLSIGPPRSRAPGRCHLAIWTMGFFTARIQGICWYMMIYADICWYIRNICLRPMLGNIWNERYRKNKLNDILYCWKVQRSGFHLGFRQSIFFPQTNSPSNTVLWYWIDICLEVPYGIRLSKPQKHQWWWNRQTQFNHLHVMWYIALFLVGGFNPSETYQSLGISWNHHPKYGSNNILYMNTWIIVNLNI